MSGHNKPEPVAEATRLIVQEIDNARKVFANANFRDDGRVVTSVGGKTIWGAMEVVIESVVAKAVAVAVAKREAEIADENKRLREALEATLENMRNFCDNSQTDEALKVKIQAALAGGE